MVIFFDVFAEDDDEDGEDARSTKRGKMDSEGRANFVQPITSTSHCHIK